MRAADPSAAGSAGKPDPPDRKTLDPLAQQFRREAGKVSRQASVFLAGTIFTVVCGYLFKIYVSREIGATGLGLYALGMSTVGFFALFSGLGLPQVAARFVSIYRGRGEAANIRHLFWQGLLWLTVSSCSLGTLMFASRRWLAETIYHEHELLRYLPWFAVLLVLSTFHNFLGSYLRGHQEVARRTVINHFVHLPAKILLTVGLFAMGWGLLGYVAAELASLFLTLLLLAAVAHRLTPKAKDPRPTVPGRKELTFATSMVGLDLVAFSASRTGLLLLGIFLAADQVGIYSIAVATASFVPTLLVALNSIFGPVIADLHARRQTELLQRLFQTSTKWCFSLTWPLVAVIVFFSRDLMGLFGASFEAGAPVLALLALAQLVNVAVGSVGNLLVMSGHQRLEIFNSVLMAALTLPLSVVLIPRWGMLGAAVALASGMAGANLLRAWLVWRHLGLVPYDRRQWALAAPLASSGLAALGVWRWIPLGSSVLEMMLALVAAYGALAVSAAVSLDRDDRIILQAVREKLRHYWQRPRPRRG